jgi:comEA protein
VNFYGNKGKKFLLIVGAVSLCVGVVWPFLRGGSSSFQTAFRPMNSEMKELLSPITSPKTSPIASPKVSSTPDLKLKGKATSTPVETSTPPISSKPPATTSTTAPVAKSTNPTATLPTTQSTTESTEPQSLLLDLNTATLEQLDKLPGIGESKAKAILDYRLKRGRFKRVEELMDVKGIGEKMLEKLKELVFVTPM